MPAELPQPASGETETAEPPARRLIDGWRVFWILTLLVVGMLFLRDLINTESGLSIDGEALWGRDFVNVHASGALALQGRLDILYDVDAYRTFQLEHFDGGLQNHNYSYPPVTLLYTWLFALLPYPLAWILWLAGTGALFVRAARPYLAGAGLPAWVALVAPASLLNIWTGHYGFLVGALWLLAWSLLPRRPALSGILIGLIVVKPHLAILAPLVLLWRREWTAFVTASATVIALIGLSVALFGPALWVTYLTETAVLQAAMVDDVGAFFVAMMPTVTPALSIIGTPIVVAAVVQAMVAIAAMAMLLRYLPGDSRQAGLATATATFLILPYAFAYDMTVAGLAGLILFRQAQGARSPAYALAIGMAAFVPLGVIYFNLAHVPAAPLLIGFQLLVMLGLVRQGARRTEVGEGGAQAPPIRPPG